MIFFLHLEKYVEVQHGRVEVNLAGAGAVAGRSVARKDPLVVI